jgi:hypothetical protein
MIRYPLMFTFKDAISGNGFLAGVTLSGRALMVNEDGEWWVQGVRPAAIAETGQTPQEAYLRFRNRYKEVLFDIAGDCADFEAFKGEVERFFNEPHIEEERRWNDAVADLRSGKVTPEPPFTDLPREQPEMRPTQIFVDRLDKSDRDFAAIDNVPDMYVAAA